MAGTPTRAGTGYGATLSISSTPATLSVPAPAPTFPPTRFVLTSVGPIATTTLGFGGTSGYTSATALPTTTNGSGSGATITIVAAAGVITSATAVALGTGYAVGDRVYPTQSGGVGPAYVTVATITGSTVTGIPILQIKNPTMPSQKISFDDVSCLSSPTQGTVVLKENLPTMLDAGEFTAEGVFLPSDPGLLAVQTAFYSGLANQFQVQLLPLPGQSTIGNCYCFNGWMQENPLPSGISVEKVINWKVNIKLSSFLTIAVGS